MKLKAIILSTFVIVASLAQAQDHLFKVLAAKNSKVSSGTSWTAASSGTKLNKGNELKVATGGYVGLIHKSGKTMEIKKPGTYDVSDLSQKLNAKSSGFANKYASFVYSEMTGGESVRKNYEVTGSVDRGVNEINLKALNNKKDFNILVSNIPVLIDWDDQGDDVQYDIYITNLFGERIFATSTDVSEAHIDLTDAAFEGEVYILNIATDANDSQDTADYKLKIISGEEAAAIKADMEKLGLNRESAIDNLVLASFFEEKGMVMNANEAYLKAIELEPEIEIYQEEYDKFKKHYSIK